jgi:hypothetical protein
VRGVVPVGSIGFRLHVVLRQVLGRGAAESAGGAGEHGAPVAAGREWRRRLCRVRKREELDGSASNGRKGAGFARGSLRRSRHLRPGGHSIEFPGVLLEGLGYYFGLTSQDRLSQILGIAAAVLNVISMIISGLSGPPQ